MKTIPRATLLNFGEIGPDPLRRIIDGAKTAVLDDDAKTETQKIDGFTSPRFDGDRRIDDEACAYGHGIVRLNATEADRKIPASSLRAKVGEEVEAVKRERGVRNIARKEVAEIKESIRKRLRGKAPVSYAVADIYIDTENGEGLTTAAPETKAMDRVETLLARSTATSFWAVTSRMVPRAYKDSPREPLDRLGQSAMFSDPRDAGTEFLTWLVIESEKEQPVKSEVGTTFRPNTPCVLTSGIRIKIDSGELYCPELREAMLSGKMVSSVRLVVKRGDDVWSGILHENLSVTQLEVPPVDKYDDPKSIYRKQMRDALDYLDFIHDLFKFWIDNIRTDKKKWERFAAACRLTKIAAIGSKQNVEQAAAQFERTSQDVDKLDLLGKEAASC